MVDDTAPSTSVARIQTRNNVSMCTTVGSRVYAYSARFLSQQSVGIPQEAAQTTAGRALPTGTGAAASDARLVERVPARLAQQAPKPRAADQVARDDAAVKTPRTPGGQVHR